MGVKTRVEEIDFLRGAAIVMVVFGHAIIALEKAGLYGNATIVPDAVILIFYAIHMPTIFFVSGLVSHDHERTPRQFFAATAKWILFPYVLWSVITVFLQHLAPSANNLVPFQDLLFIAWSPILLFWFLQTLFLVKALTFLLAWGGVNRIWLSLSLATVSLVAYPLLPESEPRVLGNFVGFLFFYEIGVLFAALPATREKYGPCFKANAGKIGIGAVSGVTILIALTRLGWFGAPRPVDGAQITLHMTGMLGIACLAAGAALLGRSALIDALAVCGRYSMAIYVLHTIFVAATRIVLLRLGAANPWLVALACGTVGVLVPILGQKFTDRRNWSRYLGIRPVVGAVGRPTRSPVEAASAAKA